MESLCTKLNKILNIALYIVFFVWKTILINILQKKVKILFIHYLSDYLYK